VTVDGSLIFLPLAPASHIRDANQQLAEEAAEIWTSGNGGRSLTFWPRALLQLTLPHHNPGAVPVWGRRSGDFYLVVEPGHYLDAEGRAATHGYPYGSLPRLIFTFLNRQAKLTRNPTIDLGESLAAFMRELGLGPHQTGGINGSTTRLRRQLLATLNARIAYGRNPTGGEQRANALIASEYELWWDPKSLGQMSLYPNWVRLDDRLFQEFVAHGVPLDMRVLKALKRSPLALDLYAWSAYRDFSRKERLAVSWEALGRQFGNDYATTKEFARRAKAAFTKVQVLCPDLVLDYERGRVILGERARHPTA
jgi:Plasmid encoded RepA protein